MAPTRRHEIGHWSFWLRRLHPSRHLTEREIAAMSVGDDATVDPIMQAAAAHAEVCPQCAARRSQTRVVLRHLVNAAEAAFDVEMPPNRLARQRQRILRRIDRVLGQRPARILRFPSVGPPSVRRASGTARWFGATAAAGLLIGIALVQPGDAPRSAWEGTRPDTGTRTTSASLEPARETPPAAMTDEQLMRDLEAALATERVEPLLTLDEMTPRLRAASTDIR